MRSQLNLFHGFCLSVLMLSAIGMVNAKEIDLVIPNQDVDVAGTLTLPDEKKSNSLVIMLSGSGPQDRDETLDGFKVFKGLAEHLGSQGIANFRFDDRGVGFSTGDFVNSTLADHARDVEGIMAYFSEHKQYAFQEFILLGHSQGSIVAANVAINNPQVKKVVLMAGPAAPLIDLVLYQERHEYVGMDLDKSLVEAEVSAHNRLIRAIRDGKNLNAVLKEFKNSTRAVLAKLPSLQNKTAAELDQMAFAQTQEFEVIYALPSLTSFLYHDTAKDYEKLQVPVLALFGGKDLQVTIDQNKDRMENALLKAGVDYHFATFHHANHYFQNAVTGERDEYETLDKAFVGGFLDEVSNWLLRD